MPTIRTNELTSWHLDWAVAQCELAAWQAYDEALDADDFATHLPTRPSEFLRDYEFGPFFRPSTDWAQGGPIIEREGIDLHYVGGGGWSASKYAAKWHCNDYGCLGPAALVAAMRCYVTATLGEEIDVPEELALS